MGSKSIKKYRKNINYTIRIYTIKYLSYMSKIFYLFALILTLEQARAQQDTAANSSTNEIMRIVNDVKSYKPDTSDVPNDKLTRKIKEFRDRKGGFNINTVMDYKIQEDLGKNDLSKERADKLKQEFTTGRARRLLDNAIIWLYRKTFTYKEMKQLARFYNSKAGQKYSEFFIPMLLKSVVAAENIQKQIMQEIKN